MSVTLRVDYSNGVIKTYSHVPVQSGASVIDTLDLAATLKPGLIYEFDADFVDRGGREVGSITSVDGFNADGMFWGIWLNDREISSLRRVVDSSFARVSMVTINDGDVITLKWMRAD